MLQLRLTTWIRPPFGPRAGVHDIVEPNVPIQIQRAVLDRDVKHRVQWTISSRVNIVPPESALPTPLRLLSLLRSSSIGMRISMSPKLSRSNSKTRDDNLERGHLVIWVLLHLARS